MLKNLNTDIKITETVNPRQQDTGLVLTNHKEIFTFSETPDTSYVSDAVVNILKKQLVLKKRKRKNLEHVKLECV